MSPALPAPDRSAQRRLPVGWLLVLAGLGAFAMGLATDPARAWSAWLVAAFGVLVLGLGAASVVALIHVTGGRWADGLLYVAHRAAALIPVGAGLVLVAAAGAGHLYPWTDAARVEHDPVLHDRAVWMTPAFVAARWVLFGLVWTATARALARRGAAIGRDGDAGARRGAARAAGLFLALLAPTFSIACFDVLLSIEPHWPSTLFAWLHAAGMFEAGVAVVVLGVLAERRAGRLDVGPDALHDLGKLLFAFAFFWGYLWFCQWMLVWYTNMPEETSHYAVRHTGSWQPLAIVNVLLGFALPFVLLLSRHAKRSPALLGRVAAVALLARWIDLTLAVQPGVRGATMSLGVVELALGAAAVGVTALVLRVPGAVAADAARGPAPSGRRASPLEVA